MAVIVLLIIFLVLLGQTNARAVRVDELLGRSGRSHSSGSSGSSGETSEPYGPIVPMGLPVVILNGVASSANNMLQLAEWIGKEFHVPVYIFEIGQASSESIFYRTVPEQVDAFCDKVYKNSALALGFNFIGMAQGELLARGYVERCNQFPVKNLITMVAPHNAVYPKAKMDKYAEYIQPHLSLASYWRDPQNLKAFLAKCNFLPLLNNEISATQKAHVANLVLIWSPRKFLHPFLHPTEKSKWSIPLAETEVYQLIRVKYIDTQNRFHIYETNCTNMLNRDAMCFRQLRAILSLYLF